MTGMVPSMTESSPPFALSEPIASPTGRHYVYCPIPVEFLDQVNAMVAKLNEQSTFGTVPGPDPLDPTPGPDPDSVDTFPVGGGPADPVRRGSAATEIGNPNGVWTREEFHTLANAGTASAERVLRVMRAMSEVPPETTLSTSDLVEATGIKNTLIRNALSKLTLFVATRPAIYGEVIWWPFGWKYGARVDPENPREFHYYFSPEQYAAWHDAFDQ